MCAFDLIKVLGKESGKEGKRRREGRGEREKTSSFLSVPVKMAISWWFLSTLSCAFPLCSLTSTLLSALLPTSLWFL